jgi:hypothetical protein
MADSTITCRSCGAEADAGLVRCPECNTRLRPLRGGDTTSSSAPPAAAVDEPQAPRPVTTAPTPAAVPTPVTAAPTASEGTTTTGCMVCGRGPTVEVKLRSVTGMILAFRTQTVTGRFCRQCGESVFRDRMNRTLLTGWWGIVSFFFNWYVVLSNLSARTKIRNLGHPQGEPTAPPLDPGKGLPRRLGMYVGLAVILVLITILGNATQDSPASSFAGKCVRFDTGGEKVLAVDSCDDSHDAKVVAVVKSRTECPEGTDGDIRLKVEDDKILCVDADL